MLRPAERTPGRRGRGCRGLTTVAGPRLLAVAVQVGARSATCSSASPRRVSHADATPAGIDGVLQYASDRFDRGTVESIAGAAGQDAGGDGGGSGLPAWSEVELLGAGRGNGTSRLEKWNATTARISEGDLAEAFEARVAAAPDAEAVVCGEVRLTAAELNARANALARRLNAAGVGPETPVVVLMRRSTDVVITLLAVVKAGGPYVPLHPGLPPARMRWIAEQTRAQVVITDDTHAGHELTRHLPAMTTGPKSRTTPATRTGMGEGDLAEAPVEPPGEGTDWRSPPTGWPTRCSPPAPPECPKASR